MLFIDPDCPIKYRKSRAYRWAAQRSTMNIYLFLRREGTDKNNDEIKRPWEVRIRKKKFIFIASEHERGFTFFDIRLEIWEWYARRRRI